MGMNSARAISMKSSGGRPVKEEMYCRQKEYEKTVNTLLVQSTAEHCEGVASEPRHTRRPCDSGKDNNSSRERTFEYEDV